MGPAFSRSRSRPNTSSASDVTIHVQESATEASLVATGIPVAEPSLTTPAMPPAMPEAGSTTLTISSERSAIAYDAPQSLLAMLSIKAPAAPAELKRPAMDLVAVVDRSGSMQGQKMRLMKQTLELLVNRSGLKESDRVSLVSFDREVKLELPLTSMSHDGKVMADLVVKRMEPGSTTNLSGGALKAIDVLDASTDAMPPPTNGAKTESRTRWMPPPTNGAKTESRTRAVMLFTDGLANEGIRDTGALVVAVNNALASASAKLGGPISIFTFGFGADHNEDCLRSLATNSGASGLYYYVASSEDIPNAFADCLGGLTSVVAQNATLSLSALGDGASISRVLDNQTYKRDADGSLVLGDLFAEDEKDVLVELSLPALPTPAELLTPILRAELRSFSVTRAAPEQAETVLALRRPTTTPADQPANTALDAQRNRIEAAVAMEEASRLADSGNLAAGRHRLAAMKRKIQDSPSNQCPLSLALVGEAEQLEVTYQTADLYRTVGSKFSKMQAASHLRQRATHSNPQTYKSGASRKAELKANWMASISSSSSRPAAAAGHDSDSD